VTFDEVICELRGLVGCAVEFFAVSEGRRVAGGRGVLGRNVGFAVGVGGLVDGGDGVMVFAVGSDGAFALDRDRFVGARWRGRRLVVRDDRGVEVVVVRPRRRS
jgi:hypothetical protein